ncbi:MAG: hypothetical protein ACOYMX_06005 [Burkholderiales bacterium]
MPREAPDASDLAMHARFMATVRRTMQNMSCRPQADAKHNGRNATTAVRFGFTFEKGETPTLAAVLQQLGIEAPDSANALHQVERLARKPCPLLAHLPAVTAAHTALPGEKHIGLTNHPLLVLAVLARSDAGVFLRDRPPAISQERLLRSVTLLMPPSWKPTP